MTWELAMISVAEAARAHRDAERDASAFYAGELALEQAQEALERQEVTLRAVRKDLLAAAAGAGR